MLLIMFMFVKSKKTPLMYSPLSILNFLNKIKYIAIEVECTYLNPY